MNENYYKKYKTLFDNHGVTEKMYFWDMIKMTLKRLKLL